MHILIETARELEHTTLLIRRFSIPSGKKTRWVNDPIPILKSALQEWNKELTDHYVAELQKYNLEPYAQAYLPKKSIKTNAKKHQSSPSIIKFDFSGFYDSVSFEYIKNDICSLTDATENDLRLIERLLIDPSTKGVTQGLPVSGALAGLALIPFWKLLRENLDQDITFTQYSDDLTFSVINNKPNHHFTIDSITSLILDTLLQSDRNFQLNQVKTCIQTRQFRKITGVRVNHNNQLSCSRDDYRLFRTITHVLTKEIDTMKVLQQFGFKNRASFSGKISYMRSIDETGKIDKLINANQESFLRHGLFKTWFTEKVSLFG